MASEPLLTTNLPLGPVRRGKVRDVYDLGGTLLIVSTDRISAFDWILPTGIPDKGRVLTQLSAYWFGELSAPNHMLSIDVDSFVDSTGHPLIPSRDRPSLAGRSMLVRKAEVVPIECVVRGFLSGSGWKEYRENGAVCGVRLPKGLVESSQLPEPIFTPATKAESGHDQNISFDVMQGLVGAEVAAALRDRSLEVYRQGAELAAQRGILIADTKFEWGFSQGELILVDEVLTPDSSRFWPAGDYQSGRPQASFDKQFVRDWLESTGWDKESPPPPLPAEIASKTRERYIEAYTLLTGKAFSFA
jgi:phosphoribosylaminoimidazole-succinocarboxamide synthase